MQESNANARIDDFVRETQKLTGQVIHERPVWNSMVTADAIRHFAWGISDDNPLWLDPDHAAQGPYGRFAAPPAFLTSVLYPILHGAPVDAPLASLIAGLEFQWFVPMLEGDKLRASAKQTGVFDRKDSAGRRLVYVISETTYWNQEDKIVGIATGSMARVAHADSELLMDRRVYEYSQDELTRIQEALLQQARTGDRGLSGTPIKSGTKLSPFVQGPLTIGDLVCWQSAIGPSYRAGTLGYLDGLRAPHTTVKNPATGWPVKYSQQHEDFLLASQRGMPAPFDNGVMRFAWLTPMLTNWIGDHGFLKQLSVQILEPNLYGDTTWYEGVVTKMDHHSTGGLVSLRISGKNQLGETTTTGNAEVFIPLCTSTSITQFTGASALAEVPENIGENFVGTHEMVEKWAQRTPQAIALVYQSQKFTYFQVNARANQLGRYLQSQSIGPNTLVAVFMERSSDIVVANLAVLKAGGTFLPLDSEYPKDRLASMLQNSQAVFVLTDFKVKHLLPQTSATILELNSLKAELPRYSATNLHTTLDSSSGAYVMYTSGSLDRPKGVLVPHVSLSRYLQAINDVLKVTEKDVYLHQPGLTRERFIPDPFSNNPHHHLYRTGDLGKYQANGDLEFIGRRDRRLKLRGFRIEVEEIENALTSCSQIKEAVVVSSKGSHGDNQLVAYVVPSQHASPTMGEFKRYVLPNNLAVAHLHKHETDFSYRAVFEEHTYLKHGISIEEGDCIVDVGANIGLFSLFASFRCQRQKIYAFEPNPRAFQALRANATLYNPDIKLFNCGLSDRGTSGRFTAFKQYSLLSGFYPDVENEKAVIKSFFRNHQRSTNLTFEEVRPEDDRLLESAFSSETFTTPMRTLSEVIESEKISTINLLKINVEKSEVDVLRGIKESDWPRIQQIVSKVDTPENLDQILDLLGTKGYELIVEQDALLKSTNIHSVFALRSDIGRSLGRERKGRPSIESLSNMPPPILSPDELKASLSQKLPDYMVPSRIILLASLPLTPSGKIDFKALAADGHPDSKEKKSWLVPALPSELLIAEIWKEVLNIQKVRVSDKFLEVGGDSISAIRFINKFEESSGVRISFPELLLQTLGQLANSVDDKQRKEKKLGFGIK